MNSQVLEARKSHVLPGDACFLKICRESLYRDAKINLKTIRNSDGEISGWSFNDHYYSFLSDFNLSLDGSSIKAKHRDKTVVMRDRNGIEKCYIGEWNGIYYTIKSEEGGYFYFSKDIKPPEILRSNLRDSSDMSNRKEINYFVEDDLSGIKSYNAYVDGKWVLLARDTKSDKFYYEFDERIQRNKWHEWEIKITDYTGNELIEGKTFYY